MGTEFSASSNSFEWFYQARVVLYAGGYSSNELIFNAKGSNKHNWFGFNRLKNEPWSDIRTESLTLSLSLQFPNMATALLSTACTVDVLRMMNGWWQQNRSEPQQNCLPQEQMKNISGSVCYFSRITRVGYEKILGCQSKNNFVFLQCL